MPDVQAWSAGRAAPVRLARQIEISLTLPYLMLCFLVISDLNISYLAYLSAFIPTEKKSCLIFIKCNTLDNILYFAALYYSVLYCIVLYCTVLC